MAGDQLVVPIGVTHISLPLQEYNRGSWRKENKRTKRTICLGLTQKQNSTKLLECRLIFPHCGWTLISSHWSHRSGVRCRLPLPVVPRQLSVSSFFQPTLFSRPVTTSGHAEISIPKPFVWFRTKTDKGIVCLAGHLHSVTLPLRARMDLGVMAMKGNSAFVRFQPLLESFHKMV